MAAGVYETTIKSGASSFRASVTYRGKHISLGSFQNKAAANRAYQTALLLLRSDEGKKLSIAHFASCGRPLPFEKWVSLINLRDNGIYIKTPIYLFRKYFLYYYDEETTLTFDVDDLFYFSNHKIMKRGGHLFVADYGMQVTLTSRYGIKPFAVAGRDYLFRNGDIFDFRYGNVEIFNRYYGITRCKIGKDPGYLVKIHGNGDVIVGKYRNEIDAALAYNKAADRLKSIGLKKEFRRNYIDSLTEKELSLRYQNVKLSKSFLRYLRENRVGGRSEKIE